MTDHFVYVHSKEYSWIPATLIEEDGETATVSIQDYESEQSVGLDDDSPRTLVTEKVSLKDYSNNTLALQNADESGRLVVVSDMVDLMFLHEAAILYNLKNRHVESKPYTRTGGIIIAVNPYRWISRLYSPERRHLYSQELIWNPTQEEGISVEPHVYEISALAYKGLALEGKNQSILVSGESGAGKTETVKICMNHIASIQSGPDSRGMALAGDTSHVVQRILDSNPLLEAFGNAKTRRNDNSSRFGKFIQLQFHRSQDPASRSVNVPQCHLSGSRCEVYLLEKSRVVVHEAQERTFHIFYQLLAAPNNKQFWPRLEGTDFESFHYIGATDTTQIEGVSDADRFQRTIDALSHVGVVGEKLDFLMRGICSVVQMGNVSFVPGKNEETCTIQSRRELEALADITGIPERDLEYALTHRTVTVRMETTSVALKHDVAKEFLDALAKHVYSLLFSWLGQAINDATCATKQETNNLPQKFGTIGLLDIFGFEYFETNSFEQLCINFANEMLQSKFTKDVFQSVFEEYAYEGLSLDRIHYDDNTDVLDLLQTPRTGVLSILNEECILPKGNDESFCYKVITNRMSSRVLFTHHTFDKRYNFGIHHYAESVVYDSRNFLRKNQDKLPQDLVDCFMKSSNNIVVAELKREDNSAGPNIPRKSKSALVAPTIWTKYKSQLVNLMRNLDKSQNRYIRCIKPNNKKQPILMQHAPTLSQLRSAGVIAAVTMSRAAFPNRIEHKQVLDRFDAVWRLYWCRRHGLSPPKKSTRSSNLEKNREDNERLLSAALDPLECEVNGKMQTAYAVGKTRTYFITGAYEYLEALRFKALENCATIVQKRVRGILARTAKHAIVRLQCWWRVILARKRLVALKEERKRRQKELQRQNAAATCIQAITRGKLVRRRVARDKFIHQKYHDLDSELAMMKLQVYMLQMALDDGTKDHQRKMKELHSLQTVEAEEHDAIAAMHMSRQETVMENDEVQKLQNTNKALRKELHRLEKEKKHIDHNTQIVSESNEEAGEKLLGAKNLHIKLVVEHSRLEGEYKNFEHLLDRNIRKKEARLNQYKLEKKCIAIYQKSIKSIVKRVNKKMPDTRLATEVERAAQLCMNTIETTDFHDSVADLTSETCSTGSFSNDDNSDSSIEFDDF